MTEVTKDVILDLLPLYIGGEVSQDTAKLIQNYLDSDPELAKLAQQMTQANINNEVPKPRRKEAEMESFEKTKMLIIAAFGISSLIIVGLFVLAGIWLFVH